MNKNSNTYIITYASVMVVIVAAVLSLLNTYPLLVSQNLMVSSTHQR